MRHLMSPLDLSVPKSLRSFWILPAILRKTPKNTHIPVTTNGLPHFSMSQVHVPDLSFEAAMMNLGGKVLGFSSADSSSAAKGESVADTIRVVSCYADICAMRHPKEGAPLVASMASNIPVINAGDGGHQHPTQTLNRLTYHPFP